MPLGLLPVRGKVRARLFVPQADAVGLAKSQVVRIRLNAASDKEFAAVVESVSPIATPRNRADPQEFFSVEALIESVDPDLMRVGSQLRATIVTGNIEQGFGVPAQLAHHRLRTALTLLGMVFGVGAVIAMLAVSEGGKRHRASVGQPPQ